MTHILRFAMTLRRVSNRNVLPILFGLLPLVVMAQLPQRSSAPMTCSGSFVGNWSPVSSEGGSLQIAIVKNMLEGDYVLGSTHRKFTGSLRGELFGGTWTVVGLPERGPRPSPKSGEVEGRLLNPQTLEMTFRFGENILDSSKWLCTASDTSALESQETKKTPKQVVEKSSLPAEVLKILSDPRDSDDFRTFDAQPEAEQQKWLARNGPRLPSTYSTSDLSMRVFIKDGWPGVLDYRLDDGEAELTITVVGVKPVVIKLFPTQRSQISIGYSTSFGMTPRVAKLRIRMITKGQKPGGLRLYGLALGPGGLQGYIQRDRFNSGFRWAMTSQRSGLLAGLVKESFAIPYSEEASIQDPEEGAIHIDPPTTIKLNQKPRQVVTFRFTFRSAFNGARWQIYQDQGTSWTYMDWEKNIGSVRANQTEQSNWDGVISGRKKRVSPSYYVIQLEVWHGLVDGNPDWYWLNSSDDITIE